MKTQIQKTSKDPRMEGMPWLMPYLTVRDPAKAISFYEKAFGFKKINSVQGEDGSLQHVEMKQEEAVIMFGPEGAYGGTAKAPATSKVESGISLYVYCRDVDARYEQAKAAGAEVVMELQDAFWGDRTCQFKDPDGYRWSFATNLGFKK